MSKRINTLDQSLDIAGSQQPSSSLILSDEPLGLGKIVSGQTGLAANIIAVSSPNVTISGLTLMTANSVGRYLTISGAATSANNGTFQIIQYLSSSSVVINNSSGVAPDANNGSISWAERNAYSLQDDLNYARTDRSAIKGVAYSADVPTYSIPDSLTPKIANLANIAGNTTDAKSVVTNIRYNGINLLSGNTFITITNTGNLPHATISNKLGVPVFDGFDINNYNSCYTEIYSEAGLPLFAVGGISDGYKIFGLTRGGSSVSPNSVEIAFRAVPITSDISNSIAYTWDGYQPTTININYPYRNTLEAINENALRDIVKPTNSEPTLSKTNHAKLRQLVHLAAGSGGPFEGFNNPYKEILPSNAINPTSIIWYEDNTKTIKIVEKTILYSNNLPINIQWKAYDIDGATILATVTDVITYSGVFESSRTRTVSNTLNPSVFLTEETHKNIRQLVHLADGIGGPFEGFVSGSYREILPAASPFPESIIWWEDSSKLKKIVEKSLSYNANKSVSSVMYKVYDTDGITVLSTSSDSITYSGIFEQNRTRAMS